MSAKSATGRLRSPRQRDAGEVGEPRNLRLTTGESRGEYSLPDFMDSDRREGMGGGLQGPVLPKLRLPVTVSTRE